MFARSPGELKVSPTGEFAGDLYNPKPKLARQEAKMTKAVIAVWERSPYWVPELQRALADLDVRIAGCSREQDVIEWLASGAGQLVVALSSDEQLPLPALAKWIPQGVEVHVVLDSSHTTFRWFLSELGTASVFSFDEAREHLARRVRQTTGLVPTIARTTSR
jgi:hypothetical protein